MQTTRKSLDLRLYLVTDSTPEILGDKDLANIVEEAIKGGVTIVQYRDKHADTGELIATATRLHKITQQHNIPLLINDRIDVCLAVGAEGVHIGQDDADIAVARRLLPNAIIGVTASSVEEANAAIDGGADYLGIGTMFATPTKKDTKSIIGTIGTREILAKCRTGTAFDVGCVAIGSINARNVQHVLHQARTDSNALNGVAVVSAIVAASDPKQAATQLNERIKDKDVKFHVRAAPNATLAHTEDILGEIPSIIGRHAQASTLSHNMTNTVVQNFAANVCLATGASPIMSTNAEEAADLAKLGGGLVINMGTITADSMRAYQSGVQAYNAIGSPVLLDPVGGGATQVRRDTIATLLRAGFFDLIKGNEGEISAVLGASTVQQRGVDSGPSTSDVQQKVEMVKSLAIRERCLVLMTGAVDYLSDGHTTIGISNGSHYLGKITGSGCALGSVLVSYLALHRTDKLVAALAAILHYELAAERAEQSESCKGPGSFIPAFLDSLHTIAEDGRGIDIAGLAKLEFL